MTVNNIARFRRLRATIFTSIALFVCLLLRSTFDLMQIVMISRHFVARFLSLARESPFISLESFKLCNLTENTDDTQKKLHNKMLINIWVRKSTAKNSIHDLPAPRCCRDISTQLIIKRSVMHFWIVCRRFVAHMVSRIKKFYLQIIILD